jgi:thiamine-phosphate pyrophosphorylase
MRSVHALAATAARLNRDAGAPRFLRCTFFTDPERTPDPVAIAQAAAAWNGHYLSAFWRGKSRTAHGAELGAIARSRGLRLLIAADPELALARRRGWRALAGARCRNGAAARRIVTAAAHDAPKRWRRANAARRDACVLAPVFRAAAPRAMRRLGCFTQARWRGQRIPMIALGGVNGGNARKLASDAALRASLQSMRFLKLRSGTPTRCARRARLFVFAARDSCARRRRGFQAEFAADAHVRRELVEGADRRLIAVAAFRQRAQCAELRERPP